MMTLGAYCSKVSTGTGEWRSDNGGLLLLLNVFFLLFCLLANEGRVLVGIRSESWALEPALTILWRENDFSVSFVLTLEKSIGVPFPEHCLYKF